MVDLNTLLPTTKSQTSVGQTDDEYRPLLPEPFYCTLHFHLTHSIVTYPSHLQLKLAPNT